MTTIEKTILTYIAAENDTDRQRAAQEAKAILSLMNNSPPSDATSPASDGALRTVVRKTLMDIGVPCHLKGYEYLTVALCLAVENPDILNAVTGELYPEVAKRCNTTKSRAERAIRHAIEVANDNGDYQNMMKYFGNTINANKCKPTNGQFISTLALKIRERM